MSKRRKRSNEKEMVVPDFADLLSSRCPGSSTCPFVYDAVCISGLYG